VLEGPGAAVAARRTGGEAAPMADAPGDRAVEPAEGSGDAA
jgi:hypothetical protein